MKLLVLETSSTSVKALIYHLDKTNLSASALCCIKTETLFNPTLDPTKLDPLSTLNQLLELAKRVCSGTEIDLICLVSTWHSLVLCDYDAHPLSPIYLWSNQLAETYCNQLKQDLSFTRDYYQKTGCIVSSVYPFFKLLALNEIHTAQYPLSDKLILDQGSFIMHYLTGRTVVLNSMASGTGLYSIQKRDYDDTLLNKIGIERHQLPHIVSSSQTFPLLQQAATFLGLTEGIPVMAPGPDGAFNQLGADAMVEGSMTLSVGTSGALRVFTKQPFLSSNQSTWCYALEDGWLIGAATSGACNCVDYMKACLFDSSTTYETLENELNTLIIPDNAPLFLPFMFGERSPGWKNHRQHGIVPCENYPHNDGRNAHQRALMDYYATLEGVIFNLYQCFQALTEVVGIPTTIKLSGGILNSTFWTQLCVDIFGIPMQVDEEKQASLMGGVFLAKRILSDHSSFNSQSSLPDTLTHKLQKTFLPSTSRDAVLLKPSQAKHSFYQARYQRYLDIYSLS
jgi:gluconokinase